MNEDPRRTYTRAVIDLLLEEHGFDIEQLEKAERELVELIIPGGLGRKPAEGVANKIASVLMREP